MTRCLKGTWALDMFLGRDPMIDSYEQNEEHLGSKGGLFIKTA
jgi:hypothetical protein